ncbi:MAG: alkaline phosphatase D family protein [Pseudomonadota bacterium]
MNNFDITHSPVALYRFDRTVEDYSGNGFDLIGTPIYREVEPQVFELAPGSDVRRASFDASLALTGDVTVQVLARMYATPSAHAFASFTASGESLATNTLWQFGPQTAGQFRWLQEFGASGTDATALSSGLEALPAPGVLFHAAAVRSANVIRFYLNGRLYGTASAALTAAAGGTSAVLRVMLGATSFGLQGLKVVASALTAAEIADEYDRTIGGTPLVLGTLWVGALTDTSATVVARMSGPVTDLRLAVSAGEDTWLTDPIATDADNVARFDMTDLAPGTPHTFALPCGVAGSFRTLPAAAGDPADFTVAFAGDAVLGSTHPVFQAILDTDPDMFIHLGDLHYADIATNSQTLFHAALDSVFASPTQHRLYRSVATAYVWDDHCYGSGNGDGTSVTKPAVASVYRSRAPHYPLAHATAIYQTWDIGRVRFVMTDQRSEATPDSATDNSSKSMLGATQKAWFKDIVANSPDMLIVWICPRWFARANHTDSWNNFSTERRELVDHIKANAHGRVVVLEADQHTLAIDDGSHVDHATGGGEPLACFRAAPLDRFVSTPAGVYSHGEFANNGQFGTMAVVDTGGSAIAVTWTGYDSTGAVLTSYTFSVTV